MITFYAPKSLKKLFRLRKKEKNVESINKRTKSKRKSSSIS